MREGYNFISGFLLVFTTALATLSSRQIQVGLIWSELNMYTNAGGRVGAWTAELLLYICGYLAYIISFYIFYNVWQIFERYRKVLQAPPQPLLLLRVMGYMCLFFRYWYSGLLFWLFLSLFNGRIHRKYGWISNDKSFQSHGLNFNLIALLLAAQPCYRTSWLKVVKK